MNTLIEKTNGTWVDINLDALAHNLKEVKRLAGRMDLCAVVKADGYGHGALVCAHHLQSLGVQRFAVANVTEALELRLGGIHQPILILGWTPEHRMKEVVQHNLTPTLFALSQAEHLSREAELMCGKASVHIKIDTGMNRIGFYPTMESMEAILAISRLPCLKIEGIYSHLALFFTSDNHFSLHQAHLFLDFVRTLKREGLDIPLLHMANSAGLLDISDEGFNMVRVGSALYGLYPRSGISAGQMNLKPAMTFKTLISNVKTLAAGQGVSYGHTYVTPETRRIATVPVGYVDGITKIGSGKTDALVRGKRARQVGMICMDQCMLDVTHVPEVTQGDEVIFFGTDGTHTITPDERAEILGTGNCEIVCSVSRRVPRVYWQNGQIVQVVNYVTDSPAHE